MMNTLINEAKKDMKRVRTLVHELLIGQTKVGTVALSYDRTSKTYSIVSQDGGSFKFSGSAKETSETLAGLYTVAS
jgi:hypothetical protein